MNLGQRSRVAFPVGERAAPKGRGFSLLRLLRIVVLIALVAPAAVVALYRVINPPITPLMLIRESEGEPLHQSWVPLTQISPWLPRAMVASEDQRFCQHYGFDFEAIGEAVAHYRETGKLRGASTISQQTAKNLGLWPWHSFVRKGLEAYVTVWLELLWPKSRIMEVYLNVIELGHGIYGAEAAAEAHFHKHAAALTRHEAAILAAILPNPRRLSADRPSAYVEGRAHTIEQWMEEVEVPGGKGCM
jgi:monofunctional biosynthetic peptidoglycan transglycosylase